LDCDDYFKLTIRVDFRLAEANDFVTSIFDFDMELGGFLAHLEASNGLLHSQNLLAKVFHFYSAHALVRHLDVLLSERACVFTDVLLLHFVQTPVVEQQVLGFFRVSAIEATQFGVKYLVSLIVALQQVKFALVVLGVDIVSFFKCVFCSVFIIK